MNTIYLLTSLVPILGPLILLVLLRRSAKVGMTISMIIMILLGLVVWGIDSNILVSSIFIGMHKAITIIYILLGALALVNTLKNTNAVKRINQGFLSVSNDKRVLVVIIGFLFGALIEGASGFGTPATITGPLMVAIGLNPFAAAVIALVSDSVPVSFGAVGTPITVGLGLGIESSNQIAQTITFIDLFSGVLIPLLIITMYVTISGKYIGRIKRSIIEMIPFALYVGILYTIMAFAISRILSYEFISIVTPVIVLLIVIVTTKYNFLVPKTEKEEVELTKMPLLIAWSPYVLVVILLLLTRTIIPFRDFLLSVNFLSINGLLDTALGSDFAFLYSPGTVLIIASIFASIIQKKSIKPFINSVKDSQSVLLNATLALVPTLIMVTIFTSSGFNANDLLSMPEYLALELSKFFGTNWVIGSPILGALGSFVSGSATVSNLTFGSVQTQIANGLSLDVNVFLALQVMGASIGNMICVHNVVAASAVVNLSKQEGLIIKKTIVPASIYMILVIIVGIILL